METSSPSSPVDLSDALDSLWNQAAEAFTTRVETIEDHVAALVLGDGDEELAREALHAAHKLAGTLGMFGLAGGSALASELESMLEEPGVREADDVARMAEIACALRDQIGRRSSDKYERSPGKRTRIDAVVRTVGSDRSVLESVRWISAQRGLTVGHGDPADPDAPTDVVVVDTVGTDGVSLISRWANTGAAVVALAPLDAFGERAPLLSAGANVVVSDTTPAPTIVDVAEDLLDLGHGGASVVAIGLERTEVAAAKAAFAAEGCRIEFLDDPDGLGEAVASGDTDVIVVGWALDDLYAAVAVEVIDAEPSWGSCLVVALVPSRSDMVDTARDVLAAGADDVVAVDAGWAAVAARIRDRARRAASMRRTRFGVTSDREMLITRLTQLHDVGRRSGTPLSILYFQLTGLHEVNLGHGHDAGDQLLRRTDRFLRTVFRDGDAVGPWSGAAFVAGMAADRSVATARLRSALDDLARAGIDCVGAVACAPDDGDALDQLVQTAARRSGVERGQGGARRARTIVLVEDDEVVATLVGELLQADGYRVRHVADGPSAVPLLTDPDVASDVALVLLDITLPGLDGFGVLRAMQRANTLAHLPVVMLTARTLEEEVDSAMELGAVDHVAKPFSPRVLLRRVERAIALRAA